MTVISGGSSGGSSSSSRVHAVVDSPIGRLTLVATPAGLAGLYVAGHRHAADPEAFGAAVPGRLAAAAAQLEEYFAGRRTRFDLELDLAGTAFQRRVWAELLAVGYGETVSYGELARRIGRPRAFRAVGAANGRNPVSIIVPCHRVVAAGGALTGYGGGLDRKRFLLDLESGPAGRPAG